MGSANFDRAVLTNTQFQGATCVRARFQATDLSGCFGLGEVADWRDATIDAGTALLSKGSVPQELLSASHLSAAVLEAIQSGDLILIEFKRSVWGQLFPIENALATTLGDRYIVEKSRDRILIVLDSPDQFQEALEALFPVLAGLEATSPGELARLSVEPRDSERQELVDEELSDFLRDLRRGYEQLSKGQERITATLDRAHPEQSLAEEFVIEAVRSAPVVGNILALAAEKSLQAAKQATSQQQNWGQRIYQSFKNFFRGAKGVTELPVRDKEPPTLLPASANDIEQRPPPDPEH